MPLCSVAAQSLGAEKPEARRFASCMAWGKTETNRLALSSARSTR
jgi:hypothetical protein